MRACVSACVLACMRKCVLRVPGAAVLDHGRRAGIGKGAWNIDADTDICADKDIMQTTVREQGAQGYNNVVESLHGALAGRQQVRSGTRRGAHRALHDSALRLDCAGRFSALKSCCTARGRSGPAEAASDPAFSAADAYLASAGARRRRRPFAATRRLRAHAARNCRARIYRAPRSISPPTMRDCEKPA